MSTAECFKTFPDKLNEERTHQSEISESEDLKQTSSGDCVVRNLKSETGKVC